MNGKFPERMIEDPETAPFAVTLVTSFTWSKYLPEDERDAKALEGISLAERLPRKSERCKFHNLPAKVGVDLRIIWR